MALDCDISQAGQERQLLLRAKWQRNGVSFGQCLDLWMFGIFKRQKRELPEGAAEVVGLSAAAEIVEIGETGLRASLEPAFATPRIREFVGNGRYEAGEIAFAKALIGAEDRVLELGAGLGVVSSAIMRAVQPAHYAVVEADPRLIPHIARTHELNDVAVSEIIHAAFVTDPKLLAQGYVEFVQSKAFWGSSLTLDSDLAKSRVRVPVRDMNAYLREAGITALICDIEGGELELFSKLDFAGIRKIILEIHPAIYGKRGVAKLVRRLRRAGFEQDFEHSGGPVKSFFR